MTVELVQALCDLRETLQDVVAQAEEVQALAREQEPDSDIQLLIAQMDAYTIPGLQDWVDGRYQAGSIQSLLNMLTGGDIEELVEQAT
jgi:hypothetical protein